jgi:hypothetical protein
VLDGLLAGAVVRSHGVGLSAGHGHARALHLGQQLLGLGHLLGGGLELVQVLAGGLLIVVRQRAQDLLQAAAVATQLEIELAARHGVGDPLQHGHHRGMVP